MMGTISDMLATNPRSRESPVYCHRKLLNYDLPLMPVRFRRSVMSDTRTTIHNALLTEADGPHLMAVNDPAQFPGEHR